MLTLNSPHRLSKFTYEKLEKTNRWPFQREHLQNRSKPEFAIFLYTVDKSTLPKTEKQPPRTHPESAIRHQFRFKSILKFEWSKLKTVKKRSYLHYFHVIDLQNQGVETFMKIARSVLDCYIPIIAQRQK